MAAFLGDIAFLFGILVIAAGLLVLHSASADPKPKILKITGLLLIVAGIGTAICTSYFYIKYYISGDLDHPYPSHKMSMMKNMHQMHKEQMGKMMKKDTGQITNEMNSDSGAPPGISDEEHESHHPNE